MSTALAARSGEQAVVGRDRRQRSKIEGELVGHFSQAACLEADHDRVGRGRGGLLLSVFAGLERDDVRADRPDSQRGSDSGDDVGVGVVAVQEQDLDQGAGATAVAVGLAGDLPLRNLVDFSSKVEVQSNYGARKPLGWTVDSCL